MPGWSRSRATLSDTLRMTSPAIRTIATAPPSGSRSTITRSTSSVSARGFDGPHLRQGYEDGIHGLKPAPLNEPHRNPAGPLGEAPKSELRGPRFLPGQG